MAQVILTVVFYVFLAGILVFVYLIWRAGTLDRQKLTSALVDATHASTEAAKDAAEAVRVLAQKEHPP